MQTQQNSDNDLIPDERQEPLARPEQPLAKPRMNDESDFGQMVKRPPAKKDFEQEPKKSGILGRLFGGSKKVEPWHKHHEESEETAKPQSKDWTPFELKTGIYKDPHLYQQNTAAVARHLRDEFHSVLPKFSQSNELAKRLAPKKGKGFRRSEFRDTVGDMVKEGKLRRSQARRLIGKFKAYK